MSNEKLEVFGALIQGYAQACLNLNIVAGRKAIDYISKINTLEWYPLEKWTTLEKIVLQSYKNADPILVRVGMEMMFAWYKYGPGKDLIKKGVDFLHYQTGSQGYISVIKGPKELVGNFELSKIDEGEGKAEIYSTTPFNRKMECGVLIGGMLSPGDIDYIDVVNEREPNILEIEFHVTKTHAFNEEVRLSKMLNPDVAELFWKYKGLLKERERNTVFWVSTNENLKLAYEKLDKQETELEKAYEIIQKDCAKLQQSNQNLDDFAYAASHDLQEPLRKIHAFSDRLKEKSYTALEDTGRDYIDRIQNAVKRMQRLIDDLLAYSRITTTTTSLASVDLVQIVKDVLSDLEVRIEKSAGSVEVDVLPTLEADPTQMRQLFQNLIGNALKFHKPDKAPFVKVSAGEQTPEGCCHLTVEDNGIGLDEKDYDRIFRVFQRLHGRYEYEGSGIGLAICKKIVERHGGTIGVESKPGEGSKFRIVLPLKQRTDNKKT